MGKFILVNKLKRAKSGSEEVRTRQMGESAWHWGACRNAVLWEIFLVLIFWAVLKLETYEELSSNII